MMHIHIRLNKSVFVALRPVPMHDVYISLSHCATNSKARHFTCIRTSQLANDHINGLLDWYVTYLHVSGHVTNLNLEIVAGPYPRGAHRLLQLKFVIQCDTRHNMQL